jgi:DNA-binding transcriptional LysR family regulator
LQKRAFGFGEVGMHYDLTDLRVLVLIADLGSFSAAAKRANLSLSALSERIRRLEDGAGVPLLQRTARGSAPTPAGLQLIAHARAIQLQADRLNRTVAAWKGPGAGVIRLAANSHALAGSLPDALASFRSRHKGIFVEVYEDLSEAIGRAVADGGADIGVAGASAALPNLRLIPFRSGELGLLVYRGHPLAGRRSIAFAETLDYPQISLEERSAINVFLGEKAGSLGRELVVPIRLRGFEGVCRMVSAGTGISVLPSSVVGQSTLDAGAEFIPLEDDWADCTLVLCLPRDRPVRRTVDLLANEITKTESRHFDVARSLTAAG